MRSFTAHAGEVSRTTQLIPTTHFPSPPKTAVILSGVGAPFAPTAVEEPDAASSPLDRRPFYPNALRRVPGFGTAPLIPPRGLASKMGKATELLPRTAFRRKCVASLRAPYSS